MDISRIDGIAAIIERSNNALDGSPQAQATGLVSMRPRRLKQAFNTFLQTGYRPPGTAYDLFCGTGGFALMAAALGYPAIGIDINPCAIDAAQRNHAQAVADGFIDAAIPCRFITGNVYYDTAQYNRFALAHRFDERTMPLTYDAAQYSLRDAALIYAFTWEDQTPLLLDFIAKKANPQAVLFLPQYHERLRSHVPLRQISATPFFIGMRERNVTSGASAGTQYPLQRAVHASLLPPS